MQVASMAKRRVVMRRDSIVAFVLVVVVGVNFVAVVACFVAVVACFMAVVVCFLDVLVSSMWCFGCGLRFARLDFCNFGNCSLR